MYNKSYIFKDPLTPESFRNGNGSFKKRTITHLQKPFDKCNLNSKKVLQKFQPVNTSQSILNNVTKLNQSNQELSGVFFTNVSFAFFFFNLLYNLVSYKKFF